MKQFAALILFLAVAALADRPAWVDSDKTIWKDSGSLYIKIHVTSPDLDQGMHSTEARFKEVLASHYCPDKEVRCMYFNLERQSYWEPDTTNPPNFDIYRLFKVKDVYGD